MQLSDKATSDIQESLSEIKNTLQSVWFELEGVKRDVVALNQGQNYPSERICNRLDALLMKFSRLCEDIKPITPLGILSSYQVKNPDFIDTTPLEMSEDLQKAASEIQGEIDEKCSAFCSKMVELSEGRDSIQRLADYAQLIKDLSDEISSRRNRIESLRERIRKADKDSNEQRNAATLIVKVKSMIAPLQKFLDLVLESYFKTRKRVVAEAWRTTCAIEDSYKPTTEEYKSIIPAKSAEFPITTALKELTSITARHIETNKANKMVQAKQMTALERRKMLAGLGNK